MVRRILRAGCASVALVAFAASCQDSVTDISLSNFDTLELSVVGETNIQGTVGQPIPIRFKVTDETGQSVPDVPVALTLLSESGFISPPVARSNSEGFVDAVWVLGTTVGSYELQAEGSRDDGWLSDLFRRLRLYAQAEPAEPTSVEVSPGQVVLDEGEGAQFSARITDNYGNDVDDATVGWASSRPTVATINSASGRVEAMSEGTASVTASVTGAGGERIQGSGQVIVNALQDDPPPPPDDPPPPSGDEPSGAADVAGAWSITSSPAFGTLQLEQSGSTVSGTLSAPGLPFSVHGTVNGSAVVLSGAPDLSLVFTVDGDSFTGTASGLGYPARTILGTRVTDSDLVVVASLDSYAFAAIGARTNLSATVYDSGGAQVSGTTLFWSSQNSSIASVDAQGQVTSRALGSTLIIVSAACCSAADTIPVSVSQVPTSVQVSPGNVSLEVGGSVQMSATVMDSQGTAVPNTRVDWSSDNGSVASVNSSGRAQAVGVGSTPVRARYAGLVGQASVQVDEPGSGGGSSGGGGGGGGSSVGAAFSDDFNSGSRTSKQAGYGWGNNIPNVTVSDWLGSPALSFLNNAKPRGQDNQTQQWYEFGDNLSDVWMEWDWYFQDGSEPFGNRYAHRSDGASNNKAFRLFGDDYNDKSKVGAEFEPHSNGDSQLNLMYSIDNRALGFGRIRVDNFVSNATRGRWVRFRVHYRWGTNGIIEAWWDGQKIAERSVDFASNGGARPYWNEGYLMGWANSGFDQDTYVFIDNFAVYESDPGW